MECARDLFRDVLSTSVSNKLIPDGVLEGLGKENGNSDYKLLIEGLRVFNKTGDIGTAYGDAALIQMPNNTNVFASFIVQGPFNDQRSPELIRKLTASTTVTIVSSFDTSEREIPFSSSKVNVSATGKGSEIPVDSISK